MLKLVDYTYSNKEFMAIIFLQNK